MALVKLLTVLPWAENMQFNWVVATFMNKEQTTLSDAIKRYKNLAVRIVSCWIIRKKVKWRWHSTITVGEPVLKIFINNRVIANSTEYNPVIPFAGIDVIVISPLGGAEGNSLGFIWEGWPRLYISD